MKHRILVLAVALLWAPATHAASPSFPAPDCPATIHGGAGKLTTSLLSDATHTVKRYEAGGDTNGGEVGCEYFDSVKNSNYGWTVYYLFKTDTAKQVADELNGGYEPLGGWAHPAPGNCPVSTTAYAFLDCDTSDAETVADAKAMLSAAESMAYPQTTAQPATTTTAKATAVADLVVPIESVSNGCGGGGWGQLALSVQNYLGNTSKFADSNINPLARSYTVDFKDACDLHDACYAGAVVRDKLNGGLIMDFRNSTRAYCDTKFLKDMQWQCTQQIAASALTARANCKADGGNFSVGAKSRYNLVRCLGNQFYSTTASAAGANDAARVNDEVSTLSAYCRFKKASK